MSTASTSESKSWPDYRAVWRWHFYAGLFSIPFVIILSITGGIYLFKPQIEAYSERPFENLPIIGGTTKPAAEQIQAALAAVPNSTLKEYEVPRTTTSAARVIVRTKEGAAIRVYVHPVTLAVLHTFPDSDRFSRIIFRIHGELLMGDSGSRIVELAASWTIVMILTGLYLWWPRNSPGLGGVLYPRLTSGKKIFWRDLHSVTGIWLSGFTLFFLISGLPWAKSWGNYLKAARSLTGAAVAKQEWSNTSEPAVKKKSAAGEHAGHGDHGGGSRRNRGPEKELTAADLAAVDLLVTTVYPLGLAHPVVIAPPTGESKNWSVKSMTANRPYRENLTINGETGAIVSRDGFREKHWIDKAVSVGIAAHEGALFGWPNQVLGLLTVLGLLLVCFSGLVLWWRRRDAGTLGAPKAVLNPRVSFGLLVIVILLGIYLPLFGTSLVIVLLCERIVLRRIPPVRDWLGLSTPRVHVVGSVIVGLLAVSLIGCGGPKPIIGGTPGVLRAGELQLAEMQVTVYEMQSGFPQAIGFAVTAADGSFQLVTNEARAALQLQPGLYRCTVESAGSPVRIPPALMKPETTPLQVTWAATDTELKLEVPFRLMP
jgi:uncharacterized iron-regulated membrane protein